MSDKYDVKFSKIIKLIIDVYREIIDDPLKKYQYTSDYLREIVEKEANRILDFLDEKREKDQKLQKILKKRKYREVLELLDSNQRFKI